MNRKRAASALTYVGVQAFTINYRYLSSSYVINHQYPTGTFPYGIALHVKRPPKIKKEKKGFQNMDDSTTDFQQGTMNTALCIVPPDDAWDDIQRARHLAKDPSFFTWPPAIRLFHPFVDRSSITEVASSVAELIEKYDLESFEITIDKLLILPHFEDLQQHEDTQKLLPEQAEISDQTPNDREEESVQELIEAEVRKGKKKLEKRKAKESMLRNTHNNQNEDSIDLKESQNGSNESNTFDEGNEETSRTISPGHLLEEQKQSMSEFNGPCVLYLEPNEESKIHIQAFREILRKKLFSNYDPFSPSSTVTKEDTLKLGLPRHVLKQHGLIGAQSNKSKSKRKTDGSSFRPVIPLGRFSTVTRAVEVAKKLQKVWEPLTFRVSDLQLVSKTDQYSFRSDLEEGKNSAESSDPYTIHVNEHGIPNLYENRELSLRRFHGTDGTNSILSTKGEYACDAMIMLQGEEHQLLKPQTSGTSESGVDSHVEETATSNIYLDENDEAEIMKLLMSPAAIPGGQGETQGSSSDSIDTLEGDDDDEQFLQSWLEEDEEVDDGATIIIGRIQYFMGEMRQYTGMPASSTIDGKDRAMGDNNVSGSARRRGAVHRQGDRWQEGDYGRKEKDYQP